MTAPHFAIIGAQKSASTFLQDSLDQHPEVYMAPGELPCFESPEYEAGGWNRLLAAFEGRPEPCLGFRRPNLLGDATAAERLARHLPEARLVAVLRDPIERAVSAFHHYVADGFLPVVDVETGLGRLLEAPDTLGPRAHEILDFGFYDRQLARFDAHAEAGRLHVLLHEDVGRDPAAALRRTFEFLGVDARFRPALRGRPQAVVYAGARLRFLRAANPWAFRYAADRRRRWPRGRAGAALARAVRAVDRLALAPLLGNARPTLSPGLHARLAAHYRDDVDALAARLGRELDWLAPATAG